MSMQANIVTRPEFIELVHADPVDFLRRIDRPEAFIVEGFYEANAILKFREEAFRAGLASEPSWHPLHDGCPDYHRLHDNYPKAYVKQKMHGFYYHGWYPHNQAKFVFFSEIFAIKNMLAGFAEGAFMKNIPSDGFVARVNIHHYPKGGGYQAEHIDPVGKHAHIQTLVAASEFGRDYRAGGVYARAAASDKPTYFDPLLKPGDLLVMSPGIRHGVDYIDPALPYEWRTNDGRWMILPIIVGSDYPNPEVKKPLQVASQTE
jgi:hypothetical protein